MDFAALIEYMYTGQACVSEKKLQAFMDGARYLGIKELAVVSCGNGPQQVSGAQSQSSWCLEDKSCCGDQILARSTVKEVLGNTYSVNLDTRTILVLLYPWLVGVVRISCLRDPLAPSFSSSLH